MEIENKLVKNQSKIKPKDYLLIVRAVWLEELSLAWFSLHIDQIYIIKRLYFFTFNVQFKKKNPIFKKSYVEYKKY